MPEPSFILPDVLQHDLRVVFCGTAAGHASSKAGAYYAGPGNRFWHTVYYIGLTPYPIKPENYTDVTTYGIGLTDLAKHTAGADHELKASDFDRDALQRKIDHYNPDIVAFTSKTAAKHFLAYPVVNYGLQQNINIHSRTQLFVLPSPSGAARGFWDISHWYDLADLVKAW